MKWLWYNYNMSNRLVISRNNRRTLLIDLLGGSCVNCGTTDNIEFDHVFREEMQFRIGTALLMRLDKLLKELQKCQLLCHKCHVQKTNTEYTRKKTVVHGSPSTYSNNACRCQHCRKSWSEYMKKKNHYRKSFAI